MDRLKILIAEDNKATLKLYEHFLDENIFDPCFAKTGEETLALFHSWQPEIMVLDLMLPEISGYMVLKQIREELENKDIPIIISSSLSSKEDIVSCAKFGIQGYFPKPIPWKEINLRILECLQKARPEMRDRINEMIKHLEETKGAKGKKV